METHRHFDIQTRRSFLVGLSTFVATLGINEISEAREGKIETPNSFTSEFLSSPNIQFSSRPVMGVGKDPSFNALEHREEFVKLLNRVSESELAKKLLKEIYQLLDKVRYNQKPVKLLIYVFPKGYEGRATADYLVGTSTSIGIALNNLETKHTGVGCNNQIPTNSLAEFVHEFGHVLQKLKLLDRIEKSGKSQRDTEFKQKPLEDKSVCPKNTINSGQFVWKDSDEYDTIKNHENPYRKENNLIERNQY